MWDLSAFLINTTGVPQPLSSALDPRHDFEGIREALHAADPGAARDLVERHIVGTVAVIQAETSAAGTARATG